MTDLRAAQSDLYRAMTNSPNWRQPGQTIVPLVPVRRRWWRRVMAMFRAAYQQTKGEG